MPLAAFRPEGKLWTAPIPVVFQSANSVQHATTRRGQTLNTQTLKLSTPMADESTQPPLKANPVDGMATGDTSTRDSANDGVATAPNGSLAL